MKSIAHGLPLAAALLAVTGLLAGCGNQAAEEARRQEEEARRAQVLVLLEQWEALAENAAENLQNDEGTQILVEMMRLSDAGHLLIVDKLRDPASDPGTKVLAVHSLMPLVMTDTEGVLLVPQIREVADTADDPLTLACALQLLAGPGLAELRPVFEEHAEAEDVNVRLNALAGLAELGDEEARQLLVAMAENEDLESLQRDRALFEALGTGSELDRDLVKRALDAGYTTRNTKAQALLLLSDRGDARDRMYLLELKKREGQDPLVAEVIDLALARLNERTHEAATAASATGEDGDAPVSDTGAGAGDGGEQPPAP